VALLPKFGGSATSGGGACYVRPVALLPNAGGSAASGDYYSVLIKKN
jgi:hypothetical protein